MEQDIPNAEVPADGAVCDAPGNKPFPIHDPEAAWVVEQGRVDIFLLQRINGQAVSPRRHVLRAESGDVIFGLPAAEGESHSILIAAGSPGARLRRISLRRLAELDPSGEPVLNSTVALNNWVTALSAAIVPDQPPRVYERVEPGTSVTVASGKNVACVQPVVWVRHSDGVSQFLGLEGCLPIMPGRYFPLTPRTWLTASTECSLDVIATPEFQKQDLSWEGLEYFHEVVVSTLAFQQLVVQEWEQTRLKSKISSERNLMQSALARLAHPLSERFERLLVTFDPDGDPLVLACQMVGMAAGIEIRPPSKLGYASRDPLRDIARSSNIRTRKVLLRGNWWNGDFGPLLGYKMDTKAPVVLIPSHRGYHLIDPAGGTEQRVDPEVSETVDPFAQSFYRPFPAKKLSAWDLLYFGVRSCGPEIWTILLTGLAGGLLALITPVFTGILFDTVIPGAQRKQLLQLTALLLTGAIATGMFDLTKSLTLLRLEGRMGASLQAAVWDRLLSLPAAFFRQYNAGDLAARANGIDGIRATLTGTVTNSIVSGIFSVFNLALMFYYSWRLACVALGLILVASLVTVGIGLLQVNEYRSLTKVSGWLSGQVLQFIGGIAKFRVSATENRAFATWTKGYSQLQNHVLRARILTNRFSVFNAFYMVFGSISMFFAVYYWTGRMSAGDFLAFTSAFGQLFSASMSLAGAGLQVMTLVPIFERATPILTTAPEVDTLKADPGELSGEIEVSRVAFSYSADGPTVLQDISLHIEAGQFVAFVGQSGCGKSTLFRLLLGFETPVSGGIYYDGQDLKGLDLSSVRRQMGVVLQNSSLFRGNLVSNIVGSKPLTLDDAWEAARLCGLDGDIKDMPMGMHTVVSEGGGGLSGGQRQRLMIARAIVSKPRVLLFDEATSALDNQTQAIVSRSLEGLKATRIVIAHRLSTVVNADCIHVMDQGRIVQSGTYGELIAQEGLFAQLAKRQLA